MWSAARVSQWYVGCPSWSTDCFLSFFIIILTLKSTIAWIFAFVDISFVYPQDRCNTITVICNWSVVMVGGLPIMKCGLLVFIFITILTISLQLCRYLLARLAQQYTGGQYTLCYVKLKLSIGGQTNLWSAKYVSRIGTFFTIFVICSVTWYHLSISMVSNIYII